MKKIVLTLAALATFTFASAQEEETTGFGFSQGNIMVEGNFMYNSTNDKNTETKTSEFDFNPKVGYFITDDFAVGVELGLGSNKTEVDGTETDKGSNFNAGVFGRYYFLDLGQRFKTYGEVGLGMTSRKSGIDDAEVKYTGFGAGVGLGINYFVTENFAINFGLTDILAYNSEKSDIDGADEPETSFNANLNVFNNFFNTAQFGLTWKF
jgi:outer membrane protein